MKNKIFYFPVILGVIVIVLAAFFIHQRQHAKKSELFLPSFATTDEIQKHGEAMYRQKAYAPLIETYKRMLVRFPDNIDLKKKLAFAYFGAADYEKAKPLLEEVKIASVTDAETFYELGFIANENGNSKEALQFLGRALELDSTHNGASNLLKKMSR